MSDRLSKQQLKEDALVAQTAKAADFMAQHGKTLVGAIVVVVVVAAGIVFMRASSGRSADRAAGLFTEATLSMQQGNLDAAGNQLTELVSDLGGTASGRQGKLLLGDVRYRQGRFQEAADSYRAALDAVKDDPIFGRIARRGLAASLESLGQYADAAGEYRTLAESAPNDIVRGDLLLTAARNLVEAGRRDEAIALYEELAATTGNARVTQDAKLRLAEIRGRS